MRRILCRLLVLGAVALQGCSGLGARLDLGSGATAGEDERIPGEPVEAFEVVPSPMSPVDLRRISATPKTFVPGETQAVSIRLATGAPTPVRVEIRDEADALVRAYELDEVGPEGSEVRWNGLDQAGRPVPTGVYLYRMYALDAERRVRGMYGADAMGGGEEVLPQRFTFDPKSGKISFALLEPARVRLRMGLKGLPVLRTYYSWVPLEAGEHEIEWDGLDITGKIRLDQHPKFQVNLDAKRLPQNALYLRREAISTRDPCAEICFRLEVIDPLAKTSDGLAVVGDQATFRLWVDDPEERARLIESRFEIMIFLDTVYLYEEEDGAVPFTYRLDTQALSPGSHFLTVNLLGYDQRFGIQTMELIRSEPAAAR